MKTGYKVCDAMTVKPIIVSPNQDIQECAKKMMKHGVDSLIIKEKDRPVGIFTENDLIRVVAENIDIKKTKIKDVMTKKLTTIGPEKDIFDALKLMLDKDIRRLPVVDSGKVVGFLTLKDILKIEPELFDLIVDKLELREEERKPIYGYRI